MAIPSGSGTEVLKRAYIPAITNSPQKIIDGVANHIYTILSVIVFNGHGSTTTIVKQTGAFMQSSTHQAMVLGG